ncbi:MAG TPA: ABC transporter ATP-binding protein [Thermodesulfobacteriota bacterium]
MKNQELLKVEGLNVFYGGIHALKGISFSVLRGAIVALIGANGAGKTTTLRTISGLISAQDGQIFFEEKNIVKEAAHDIAKRGITMVPEGRKIFSNLTVRENLIMGAFALNSAGKFEESLEYVFSLFPRIKERLDQLGGTLSGGEQQMLALGRALMGKPKLLMLDEPSLGLAPKITATLFERIREIHRSGTTILIIEQNARAALQMADYGYVLETGEIALEGTGAGLFLDERVKKCYLGG